MAESIIWTKQFKKIVEFYLFECPVRTYRNHKRKGEIITAKQKDPRFVYDFHKVSHCGITFEERGLDGYGLNTLRAAMKRSCPGIILKSVENKNEIVAPESDEYLIIHKNYQNHSITEGFFYCIRNAFAHGSFKQDRNYLILENNIDGNIKGIGKLKYSTLLKWIDLSNMSLEELKAYRVI